MIQNNNILALLGNYVRFARNKNWTQATYGIKIFIP